ncbi:MAG: lipoate--protein ligase family protein [Tannerella sp.]|jgi:lipoate-protein ligase A|nr:lipoate--protein ligase family protein [Tannerella sp.]
MKILLSNSDSPVYHIEWETELLRARRGEGFLLLYINRPSVIVGRHQLIESEVDVDYCRSNGIEIARRISGGGAVYHDFGNINYAFVYDRGAEAALDRDYTLPVVLTLRRLGIDAVVGARRELLAGGKKISGTASFATRDKVLFHGTLLHRVNLETMALALNGDSSKRGKHIASKPSEVMNIAEITGKEETTSDFCKRLMALFDEYINNSV